MKTKILEMGISRLSFDQNDVLSSLDVPGLRHSAVNCVSLRLLPKITLLLRPNVPFWLLIMAWGRHHWWGGSNWAQEAWE